MSHTESWPGEPSDVSEVEDELEEPADDDDWDTDEPGAPRPARQPDHERAGERECDDHDVAERSEREQQRR